MLRRAWQTAMIGLARSRRVKHWVQQRRAASDLATRYVAGATAAAGVERARSLLDAHGIRASLFYLGEYVDSAGLVAENVAAKREIADLLGRAGLDVHVSVDPTQIGYALDPALARANLFAIAEAVARAAAERHGVHALMLDMEDDSVTDATIGFHAALSAAGLPAALTLQAYRRRTEADLLPLLRAGTRVRLVKGAFAAGSAIAFTRQGEIKANFRRLIDLMLSPAARDAGFYPIIATHDHRLHAHALERAAAHGWKQGAYEFEMLLGVRGDVAAGLARRGERVRLYVPFGRDWWPHAVRRIGENPRNAWLLARSALSAT
ncbi:MAG TPA: proline dehydrogenase family protein [Stellaceae bacterium]|nr:proline dehydrogenase family protein [Stellaceae bacterium]